MSGLTSEAFAAQLRSAEDRLRAVGLSGRAAYAALCRDLARRLDLSQHLWLEGPDAPEEAALERIPLTAELDLFGLAYERFFPEVFKAERGQYFTPRPLVELMADLAEVRPGDRVLDPTCGSGTFMVVALSLWAVKVGIQEKIPTQPVQFSEVVAAAKGAIWEVVQGKFAIIFEVFIMFCILANTTMMAMRYFNSPDG